MYGHYECSCYEVEKFYGAKEAAELLNLKVHTIRRLIKRKEIPLYNVGDKRNLVRLSDIVAYAARAQTGGQ